MIEKKKKPVVKVDVFWPDIVKKKNILTERKKKCHNK